jgi:hypothetical protein
LGWAVCGSGGGSNRILWVLGNGYNRRILTYREGLTEVEVTAQRVNLATQQADAERQNAEAERLRADRLAARLRELGEEV